MGIIVVINWIWTIKLEDVKTVIILRKIRHKGGKKEWNTSNKNKNYKNKINKCNLTAIK